MQLKLINQYKITQFPGIYAIYSPSNDKYYIGSSVNLRGRLQNHCNSLIHGRHGNPVLQNYVNKYGIDELQFEILYTFDYQIKHNSSEYKTVLLAKEKEYIEIYQKDKNLYNCVFDPTIGTSETVKKPVCQYSSSGKFIKEWESRQDVKRELGLCLSTALALNIKAGSYYWSNEKVDQLDLSFLNNPDRGSGCFSKKQISVYDLWGRIICTFESIVDTAQALHVTPNQINSSLKEGHVVTGTNYRVGYGTEVQLDNSLNEQKRKRFIIVQFDQYNNYINIYPGVEQAQKILNLKSIFDNISGKTKFCGKEKYIFRKLNNELLKSCELPEVPQSLVDSAQQ